MTAIETAASLTEDDVLLIVQSFQMTLEQGSSFPGSLPSIRDAHERLGFPTSARYLGALLASASGEQGDGITLLADFVRDVARVSPRAALLMEMGRRQCFSVAFSSAREYLEKAADSRRDATAIGFSHSHSTVSSSPDSAPPKPSRARRSA